MHDEGNRDRWVDITVIPPPLKYASFEILVILEGNIASFCLALVRPGEKYRNIGNEIQKHAQANGFSVVRSYCGHGINQ